MLVQLYSGARGIKFDRSLHLCPISMCTSRDVQEGTGLSVPSMLAYAISSKVRGRTWFKTHKPSIAIDCTTWTCSCVNHVLDLQKQW